MYTFMRHIVASALLFSAAGLFSLSPAVYADEFEEAAKAEGCKLLPYDDKQRECKAAHDKVTEFCKSQANPISCQSKNAKKAFKEIKDKGGDKVKENLIAEAEKRHNNGEKCIEAREEVNEIFEEVSTTLKEELKKPETAGDEKKKTAIETILDKIKKGVPGHQEVIDDYKKAVKTCADKIDEFKKLP